MTSSTNRSIAEFVRDVHAKIRVMSPEFQARYQEWFMRLGAQEITGADVPLIVDAVTSELERLEMSFQSGGIDAPSLATARMFVQKLLDRVLLQENVPQQEKDQIRHLVIDYFPFRLLDVPGFRFSHDWFYFHIDQWQSAFGSLAGVGDLRFIEIGSFEGRCTCWMLENLLTGPGSQIVCIDTFDAYEDQERNFDANVRATGLDSKVTKLRGRSQAVLPFLSEASYDFVYVDGSHFALDVLTDAAMAWRLLKSGGTIVFDDYGLDYAFFAPSFDLPPKRAVDAFLEVIAGRYELLFQHWQVAIRKLA